MNHKRLLEEELIEFNNNIGTYWFYFELPKKSELKKVKQIKFSECNSCEELLRKIENDIYFIYLMYGISFSSFSQIDIRFDGETIKEIIFLIEFTRNKKMFSGSGIITYENEDIKSFHLNNIINYI